MVTSLSRLWTGEEDISSQEIRACSVTTQTEHGKFKARRQHIELYLLRRFCEPGFIEWDKVMKNYISNCYILTVRDVKYIRMKTRHFPQLMNIQMPFLWRHAKKKCFSTWKLLNVPSGSEESQVKSEHFNSLRYSFWYATTRNAFNFAVFLTRVWTSIFVVCVYWSL